MNKQMTPPITDLAEWAADINKREQTLAADIAGDAAELPGLEAAAGADAAELDAARTAYGMLLAKPDDAAPESAAFARSRIQAIVYRMAEAAPALAAGRLRREGLEPRRESIAAERMQLSQALIVAAERADVARLLELGFEVEAIAQRQLQRRADRVNANLPFVGFPAGAFCPIIAVGEKRSIFRDDFLPAVAAAYPDLLPQDQAEEIVGRACSALAAGVLWFAGSPSWHASPMNTTFGPHILRSLVRRDTTHGC
jgi:hypothetical protein